LENTLKLGPQSKTTKAHRTRAQAIADGDLKDWVGNNFADEYSRKGAEAHAWSLQNMAAEEKNAEQHRGA